MNLLIIALLIILIGLLLRVVYVIRRIEDRWILAESQKRDIEAQLNITTQLRDSILRAMVSGVLVLDDQSRTIIANPVAQEFLSHDLLNETLIAATRNSELDMIVQDAMQMQHADERRITHNNRIFQTVVTPVKTEAGNRLIIILNDETELRRLARARQEMVANIAHELNHPISNITLITEELMGGTIDKSKRSKKQVKHIHKEIAHLRQLVDEMRQLSRIESGQMPVKLIPLTLTAIVQDCIDPLMPMAEEKTLTIDITIDDNLIVLADEVQIEKVLRNIVHNAIKFSPEAGSIYVTARAQGEDAVISIRDEGDGIAAENLSRVFERFFQVDQARTRDTGQESGTGLGLAIARHIVLAHGGKIWVESPFGQGAIFNFTLPLEPSSLPSE